MAKSEEISGIQKAAILLIALGPDKSSSVFKHLKEDEIEQITLEIANTRSVSPAVKDKVMDEFYEVCLAQQYIAEGGIGYAKDLLEKALGAERARDVIGKLTASLQVRPFEFVRKTDASQLLNFIQDEHPQTIALILSYLSSAQASVIISALSPDKQTDVAKRIAQMDRTSPDVIKEVEKVLEQKLASLVNQDYTIVCFCRKYNTTFLHHCGWRRCDRRYFEYCRSWNRKAHYGEHGDRGSGACRRDPQEDVCIRGYSFPGRPFCTACAS